MVAIKKKKEIKKGEMTWQVQKQPTPNFLRLLLVRSFIFAFTHLILKILLTNKLFRCPIMLRSKHLHQNHCGGNKSLLVI